jgi:hypothetical protein
MLVLMSAKLFVSKILLRLFARSGIVLVRLANKITIEPLTGIVTLAELKIEINAILRRRQPQLQLQPQLQPRRQPQLQLQHQSVPCAVVSKCITPMTVHQLS